MDKFATSVFKVFNDMAFKSNCQANLHQSFSKYPITWAIIDCTEYFVQKPLRPAAQKATWSNYKHSNTFKQLIGIS